MTRVGLPLVLVLSPLSGCTPEAPADANTPNPAPPSLSEMPPLGQAPPEAPADEFRARVRIDKKPGGKRFQGVWLVEESGQEWLIAYRPDPWWRPFEGEWVLVKGESYQPQGQSIGADHLRVERLRIETPEMEHELVEVREAVELAGTFTTYTWPKKTKLEGETATVFRSEEGDTYWLAAPVEDPPALDAPCTVSGRIVEPSPFVARPGGPYLWIDDVDVPRP